VKTTYNAFALRGNLAALGGNLWNDRVGRSLRSKPEGKPDLTCAAEVFFDEILPELQNFMEQKIAAMSRTKDKEP